MGDGAESGAQDLYAEYRAEQNDHKNAAADIPERSMTIRRQVVALNGVLRLTQKPFVQRVVPVCPHHDVMAAALVYGVSHVSPACRERFHDIVGISDGTDPVLRTVKHPCRH